MMMIKPEASGNENRNAKCHIAINGSLIAIMLR